MKKVLDRNNHREVREAGILIGWRCFLRRGSFLTAVVIALLGSVSACPGTSDNTPPHFVQDPTIIGQMLKEWVDGKELSWSVAVGTVGPNGNTVAVYRHGNNQTPGPLDENSVFEIGSISKGYTGVLVANLIRQGKVGIDDELSKYTPAGIHVPNDGTREITVWDILTHHSSLPRMPENINPKNPDDPYVDYQESQMFDFLTHYVLPRPIGSEYEYSNYASGLLGYLLAKHEGVTYDELLQKTICQPLGMVSTGVEYNDEAKQNLEPGRNEELAAVPNWNLGIMAAAGGIHSNVHDQLLFLRAALGYQASPLHDVITDSWNTRQRDTSLPDTKVAFFWHILHTADDDIVWHNGGTGGYKSYLGFSPKRKVGVVVLSSGQHSVDDIGKHLLDDRLTVEALQTTSR